jgi:ATP-dependent DNA helicase PIF1
MRQKQALNVMLSGASVFLTGAPGSGKSYTLREFTKRAEKDDKVVAVTASTGIAATHIGGTTIHSWSGLGIRDQLLPGDKERLKSNDRLVKRYNTSDILVIDEISMLHGKRLDMINEVCKILRNNNLPFGGLQVIFVGDLFQLPPVTRGLEIVDFAHNSQAWGELGPKICYLNEQHRQKSSDLLSVLEAMRSGELEDWHGDILRDRLKISPPVGTEITRLYAHNVDVDKINQQHLDSLTGKLHTFEMQTRGAKAKREQLAKGILAPEQLNLKIGARVMFVVNNFKQKFVNGSQGKVVDFVEGMPVVELSANGRRIKVEPHSWSLNEDGKVRAEVTQLPLRLAWAITIHKSQGMSLDTAELDLSKTFTPGMGYVAISRVRTLDGLYIKGVNAAALQLHPDIYDLDKNLRSASANLASVTDDIEDIAQPESAAKILDHKLMERLKQWRQTRAKADGVPAYIIAHDRLLNDLALHKPTSNQQLMRLPGIGPKKLEIYGAELLAILSKA